MGIIKPQVDSNLQNRDDLMPRHWLDLKSSEDLINKVTQKELTYLEEFRKYRGLFLLECLETVYNEQYIEMNDVIEDFIDVAARYPEKIVCKRCCHIYNKPSFKSECICPECKFNPTFFPLNFDMYHRTESKVPKDPPKVFVGDPCMVNPSSIENVKKALVHVAENIINDQEERKWTIVHSDGVPYVYASDIQDNFFLCSICKEEVFKDSKEEHKSKHEGEPVFRHALDDLLLRVGPGHFEMNMAKALLSFCWVPFLKTFAQCLGFRREKALQVVRSGIDHHRSRQILRAALDAISRELLVPYVRHCISENKNVSVDGYSMWMENEVNDQGYLFMYHITFTYLLAFQLYTEGTRKNNHIRMMAARSAFAPLLYIAHHPKYQKLHLRDMCQREMYPPDLREYLESMESFSVSGKQNKAQGADFIHEEVPNRLVKSFLPPGTPTPETWKNICRKALLLKSIKENVLAKSGISLSDSGKRQPSLELEIAMMRREFRSVRYLLCPTKEKDLMTIEGEKLDSELCDFKHKAVSNYNLFKESFKEFGEFIGVKLEPVFITPEDRVEFNKIENKTKAEIGSKIEFICNSMPDKVIGNFYIEDFHKKMKKWKHADYVNYYYECVKIRGEQELQVVADEEENDE